MDAKASPVDAKEESKAIQSRFESKYRKTEGSDCWLWIGGTRGGYGSFSVHGQPQAAHRYSYKLYMGNLPSRVILSHLCKVSLCVNPSHLEVVTEGLDKRLKGIASLTGDNVTAIHSLVEAGGKPRDVAVAYGVTEGAVSSIHRSDAWLSLVKPGVT